MHFTFRTVRTFANVRQLKTRVYFTREATAKKKQHEHKPNRLAHMQSFFFRSVRAELYLLEKKLACGDFFGFVYPSGFEAFT